MYDMVRQHSVTVILTVMLQLAGCSGSAPSITRLAETDVILAFGDSLTYGTGTSADNSYPSVLATHVARTVINAGVPGELSASGLLRLPELLDEYNPALVIICHGGNDFLRKQPVEQLEKNLKKMIRLAKQAGSEVMLLAVPQPSLLMLSDAKVYRKVADEMHVPVIENALTEILSDNGLKSDAVHPNSQGYQRLAEAVETVLIQAQAI